MKSRNACEKKSYFVTVSAKRYFQRCSTRFSVLCFSLSGILVVSNEWKYLCVHVEEERGESIQVDSFVKLSLNYILTIKKASS